MAKQRQGRKKEKVDDKDDKDAGGGDDAEGVKYGDEEITLINLSLFLLMSSLVGQSSRQQLSGMNMHS